MHAYPDKDCEHGNLRASRVLLSLLVVFAAGKFMGEVFERTQAAGSHRRAGRRHHHRPGAASDWVAPSATLSTVATMGVIVLMFVVGLETRPSELFKVGGRAFVVGRGRVSCSRSRAGSRSG